MTLPRSGPQARQGLGVFCPGGIMDASGSLRQGVQAASCGQDQEGYLCDDPLRYSY